MMHNTSISAATADDALELQILRSAVAADMTERHGAGPWSSRPSKPEILRQLRASHVLLARSGAELLGTVRIVRALPGLIDSSPFTPVEKPLYVLGLAVAPQCRGRGVGRQLVEAAKEKAREWSAPALWLDAYDHGAGAGPFYLKCGFRQVGRTRFGEMPLVYFEWLAAPAA